MATRMLIYGLFTAIIGTKLVVTIHLVVRYCMRAKAMGPGRRLLSLIGGGNIFP